MSVREIRVKQIRINQGLGVFSGFCAKNIISDGTNFRLVFWWLAKYVGPCDGPVSSFYQVGLKFCIKYLVEMKVHKVELIFDQR